MATNIAPAVEAIESETMRRVGRRLIPLLMVCYFAAYLDRVNVGFAALTMNQALGLSSAIFGIGSGIFFLGYLTLEIPGALLVERWSARKWFARILITWGLISAGTAFVRTPMQFYTVRFLLGVAEAGFFPGIIVYFTHWFPMKERALAMSGLVVAIPISLAIGAPVSALSGPVIRKRVVVRISMLNGAGTIASCDGARPVGPAPVSGNRPLVTKA